MKQQIKKAVKNSKNLDEIKKALLKLFQELNKTKGITKIGYVSGILYSDGPQYFERNRILLAERTEYIRNEQNFPIFSATDIFSDEVYKKLVEGKLSQEKSREVFLIFWRELINSGFITDIFMTQRWELSEGAYDEFQTAQKKGVKIHYFNEK